MTTTSIYRQYFTPTECEMLDATPVDDLSSEINLLRILITRVLAAWQRTRQIGLEMHARILSTFSAAGLVLAGLVRLQIKLHNPLDELQAQIERGKNIGRERRRVFTYFDPPTRGIHSTPDKAG